MSKRKVTFYRQVTGVEEVKMMLHDDDIANFKTMSEEDAHHIVEEAYCDGLCFADTEILECEYPHAIEVDGEYIDISAYTKENG